VLQASSIATGDLNNDNALDIVLQGKVPAGDAVIIIYLNDGVSSFYPIAPNGIWGLYGGALAVADFDNDGMVDITVMGANNSNSRQFVMFKNLGGGFNWVTVPNPVDPLAGGMVFLCPFLANRKIILSFFKLKGTITWGDLTMDGFPDLIVTGMGLNQPFTFVFISTNTTSGLIYVSIFWGERKRGGKKTK